MRTETTTLDVGDGRRHEVDVRDYTTGSGDPAVLPHGCGLDAANVSCRYPLPELAADHRGHALDFPGHGRSDRPATRYTTGYFRRVLRAYLEEIGVESPSLVGISMGGSVALGHEARSGSPRTERFDADVVGFLA